MIRATCGCGASYPLKDEFAGQRLTCRTCGKAIEVGPPVVGAVLDPVFSAAKYLLRQKHLSISEKYYVNDEQGRPLLFVERPARLLRKIFAMLFLIGGIIFGIGLLVATMAAEDPSQGSGWRLIGLLLYVPILIATYIALEPERHVFFYRDDSKSEKILEVRQENKVVLPTARYAVYDPSGQMLARLRKNHLYNLIRKRWYCDRPDGELWVVAKEDSIVLSLLRRLAGPLFGFLRTNYIFLRNEDVIGEFNRKLTILDRYVLDLSFDEHRVLDRRVALAIGVMLDTGERR